MNLHVIINIDIGTYKYNNLFPKKEFLIRFVVMFSSVGGMRLENMELQWAIPECKTAGAVCCTQRGSDHYN